MTKRRFYASLVGYIVLALIGVATLRGAFLMVILILLAGLAAKSWIAWKREEMEERERAAEIDEPPLG